MYDKKGLALLWAEKKETSRRLVLLKAKFHYAIWIEPASNRFQTASEPAPNQIA